MLRTTYNRIIDNSIPNCLATELLLNDVSTLSDIVVDFS